MKHTRMLLVGFLIAGLSSTKNWATNEERPSYAFGGELSREQTDLSAHLTAIESYKTRLIDLEKMIQLSKSRLAQLAKNLIWIPKSTTVSVLK